MVEVKVEEKRRMRREREEEEEAGGGGGGEEGMKNVEVLGAEAVVREEEQETRAVLLLHGGPSGAEEDGGTDYREPRPDDRPSARTAERPQGPGERTPALGKPCGPKCGRRCTSRISEQRRGEIFHQYLDLTSRERRAWVYGMVAKQQKNRNTIGAASRRSMTYQYHLTDDRSAVQQVCKTFFLSTLGYNPKNDSLITTVVGKTPADRPAPAEDRRGRHAPANKIDMAPILRHIQSYGLGFESDAPERHGVPPPPPPPPPPDVNVKVMYADFKDKNRGVKCSYDTYRKAVKTRTKQGLS